MLDENAPPFSNINQAIKFLGEHGWFAPEGIPARKYAEETIEEAIVRAARQIVAETPPGIETFDRLVALYNRQPNLTSRTSTSIAQQAYSTPVPLAYVASRLAGIDRTKTVLEPSAGHGALLIEAAPKNSYANELNPFRADFLRASGFRTSTKDASAEDAFKGIRADVVIANPPFGVIKEQVTTRGGSTFEKNKVFDLSRFQPGYETREIDHALSLNALSVMTENGKAALILGGFNKLTTDREDGYGRSKAKREFYLHLYDTYNVVDHFTASGDLYAKQGAAWPVDVIIIHGRGKSARPYPFVSAPELLSSWESVGARLKDKLDEYKGRTGEDRGEGARIGASDAGERPGEPSGSAGGHAPNAGRGPNAPGQRESERPGTVHPSGVGAEPDAGGSDRAEPEHTVRDDGGDAGRPGGEPDAPVSVGTGLTVAGPRQDHARAPSEEPAPPPFEEPPPENEAEPSFLRAFNAEQRGRWDKHDNQANKDIALSLGKRLDVMRAKPDASQDFIGRLKVKLDGILYAIMGPEPSAASNGGRGSWSDFSAKAEKERTARRSAWENYRKDAERAEREKSKERAERKERQKAERKAAPRKEKPEAAPEPEKRDKETEGQTAYEPGASYARGLGTLVPKNMRDAIQTALDDLKSRIEEPTLDEYVANKIGMDAHDARWPQRFSGEQVDALALAIDNLERGSGFIIGDQTGVGKGRVNAGIMMYALQSGKIPVFVTEKPNLYADIYRDLKAIGIDDYLGRPLRMMMTNTTGSFPLDDDGIVTIKPEKKEVVEKALAAGGLPDHDIIVTTYSQMDPIGIGKSSPDGETDRRHLLSAIAPKAQFLFDEAHNVGEEKERAGKKNQASMAPLRGMFFRNIVHATSAAGNGVFYSSATYAKRPGNMDFYAATDMRLAVADPKDLGAAISKGGVPMQEVVAAMLAKAGQYVRRERSFAGVTFDTVKTPVDTDQVTGFARGLRAIYEFSDFIAGIIDAADKDAKRDGRRASSSSSAGGAGVESTHFSALMHNLIGQMLLAQKAERTADMAIEAIQRGERPIIALTNTMASFLAEFKESAGAAVGDPVTLSFTDLMLRYLDRTRHYTERKPFSSESEKKYISDAELGPLGREMFKKAKELIESIDLGRLPISPIDYMRDRIEKAGYATGEVTGRGLSVDYSGPVPVLAARSAADRGTKGRLATIKGFQSGALKAVLINAAGSTGLSLHDDAFARKKWPGGAGRRVMFIAQANPDINVFMQTLGRIHRTGQVTLPGFYQVIADAPAEIRIAAVLQQKMASLNANTTASKDSALSSDSIPDFLNEYGDIVAQQAMSEDPELHELLGRPLDDVGDDGGEMRKITGHIAMLDYPDQVLLMDKLVQQYSELIAAMEAAGENVLSGKALDLDAKKIGGITVVPKTGPSPFQGAVHLGEYDVKSERTPIRFATVKETMAKELQIEPESLPENPDAAIKQIVAKGQERTQGLFKAADERFKVYKSEVIGKRTDPEIIDKLETSLTQAKETVTNLLKVLYVGHRVSLKMPDDVKHTGYVVSIKREGKSGNPFAASDWKTAIAVPGQGIIHLPLSQTYRYRIAGQVGEDTPGRGIGIDVYHFADSHAQTAEMFDAFKANLREKRLIATGNLLAAFDFLGGRGQIAHFTMADGSIEQGIVAPKDMQSAEETAKESGQKARTGREVVDYVRENGANISTDSAITISKDGPKFRIAIQGAKATGGKYYLNKGVLDAAGEDFVKRASFMVIDTYDADKLAAIIQATIAAGASYKVEFKGGGAEQGPAPELRTFDDAFAHVSGIYDRFRAMSDDASMAPDAIREYKSTHRDALRAYTILDEARREANAMPDEKRAAHILAQAFDRAKRLLEGQ
jgi:hypothetical protein